MKITIFLNNNLNFLLIKKNNNKYIIIYNNYNNIYIKYKINFLVNIYYIKSLKYILIDHNLYKDNTNLNLLNKFIYKQLKSINFYFVKKIVFFGKGYKIKKLNKKIFNLFFNRSHLTFIKWNNLKLKKLKKSKILILSSNFKKLTNVINTIVKCRKLNIFTKKGLKLSRQIVYKKVGKKSS